MLFAVEDQINDSLDTLDRTYSKINDVLKLPVAFDDPQIKSVVGEITAAKEAILLVANKMTKNMKQPDEGENT